MYRCRISTTVRSMKNVVYITKKMVSKYNCRWYIRKYGYKRFSYVFDNDREAIIKAYKIAKKVYLWDSGYKYILVAKKYKHTKRTKFYFDKWRKIRSEYEYYSDMGGWFLREKINMLRKKEDKASKIMFKVIRNEYKKESDLKYCYVESDYILFWHMPPV